jgi:hypothetical protein
MVSERVKLQLELMSDEELLGLLTDRFDHYIFYGRRVEGEDASHEDVDFHEWQGDPVFCKGMCMEMAELIAMENYDEEEDEDDEEDEEYA